MSFVVDGSDWHVERFESVADFFSAMESLIERVHTAEERQEQVWIGDDLQSKPVSGDLDLWSFVFGSGASGELRQELAAWLGRAPGYLEEDWPEGFGADFDIFVNDGIVSRNQDLSWAHHCNLCGRPVGCLSLCRSGCFLTESASGSVPLWWVKSESDHVGFWRSQIDARDSKHNLELLATHAYPNVCFVPGVWRGLDDFAGGYVSVSRRLRKSLAILSDFGTWVFTAPPPALQEDEVVEACAGTATREIVQRRFTAYGLDVSPEAGDVSSKERYRAPREVEFAGRTLYCEWHDKLEPHQNRIYFHGPVFESENKIVLGIFSRHLPLPGHD